jgi:uncharacterized radical SAM superfamily Fe-S cluster-containing enzyme
MTILHHTFSVCPLCLRQLPAVLEAKGERIFLQKECPEHGAFSCLVWEGPPSLESWRSSRFPLSSHPGVPPKECPAGCGLREGHLQGSCAVLLEVTEACQLHCPICFADAGKPSKPAPDTASLKELLQLARKKAPQGILQISGGEPTLREDLPELLRHARDLGFPGIQVNTNGLRLGEEPSYAAKLKDAGAGWIFLQFDGLRKETHLALRGKDLREIKERALEACEKARLGVVLVPTLVEGINSGEVGDLLRFGLSRFPTVRGVHFQPATYAGRSPFSLETAPRMTLPQLMRELEEQSWGLVEASHFSPSRCEHEQCSFRGVYLVENSESLLPLGEHACGGGCRPSEDGPPSSVASVLRRWGAPIPSTSCCDTPSEESDFDRFLRLAKRGNFTLSAMAFQDAENFDLERLRSCCIHVISPQGKLIPFCAWNLTSREGRALHRPQ